MTEQPTHPIQARWVGSADVVLHATVEAVKAHRSYAAAKAGDADAARMLVDDLLHDDRVEAVAALSSGAPVAWFLYTQSKPAA